MDDIRWASAVAQADLLRQGEISAAELRAVTVEAVEALDPLLAAVVIPLLDRPGDGVPMLLKDAGQEIAGTPHWVGAAALRDADTRSPRTTALVERFEAAGFTIVGRSACPQLCHGATTEPPGFAPTRNPWDRSRTAGGSSGGSAAAVAAGLVAVAHGSDATGSLRAPAALCGVATLNPTSGRIPSVAPAGQPPNPVWRDFVLARHAEDLSAVFASLVGPPAPDGPVPAMRVGLLDHDPELGLPVHPACATAVGLAGEMLEQLGHHAEIAWPAALDDLWARSANAFTVTSDAIRPAVVTWVNERLGRPVERGELEDEVFEAVERAAARPHRELVEAEAELHAAMAPVATWWDDHDLLVTPATFQPAWPLGGPAGPARMGTLLAPFSFSGQPALSLPLHHTDDGLPIGVQLVARRGGDELLLRLAEELQRVADWTARRPPVG